MNRAQRKRLSIISSVDALVSVGETVSSGEIMDRLYDADFSVKAIPNSVHSLAMMLRGDPRYDMIAIGSEKKRHHAWRRTE